MGGWCAASRYSGIGYIGDIQDHHPHSPIGQIGAVADDIGHVQLDVVWIGRIGGLLGMGPLADYRGMGRVSDIEDAVDEPLYPGAPAVR